MDLTPVCCFKKTKQPLDRNTGFTLRKRLLSGLYDLDVVSSNGLPTHRECVGT